MAFFSASDTSLGYVAEVTPGTTPATPSLKGLRFTSENLAFNRQTIVSNELRPDRAVSDTIPVAEDAAGDINFELSYGTFDDFIEGFMMDDDGWAGGTPNTLVTGSTVRAYSIEKNFNQGATNLYHIYRGCQPNTFSVNATVQQIVTGSFGFIARSAAVAGTSVDADGYDAASGVDVFNPGDTFVMASINSVTDGSVKFRSLEFTATNNYRPQYTLGQFALAGIATGRFEVTGTAQIYFADNTLPSLFLGNSELDLEFDLGYKTGVAASKGGWYKFTFPKIKFTNMTVAAQGNNQDVLIDAQWQALYSTGDATSMVIARTALV